MKTLVSETIPKFNTFFEMRLCSNDGGNGFFVGKEVRIIFHYRSHSQFRKKKCGSRSGLRTFLVWEFVVYLSLNGSSP